MKRTEAELLGEARTHLGILMQHAQHDSEDQLVIDAISMRLSAAIEVLARLRDETEVLARLRDETRDALFDGNWSGAWGLRNRIAHGYALVDSTVVRETVNFEVPELIQRIDALVRENAGP